ncbi:DNA translocase FtsK, partial [Klebsiella pneumoniae]|nr:DNA translocase FtsK [Klebsiella pneumoniae]
LYRHEDVLAGAHAGGILGMTLGQLGERWLGFNGSGVVWIALLVAGTAMALRFSWLDLAERIGALFDGLRQQREARREEA